uniref:Mucin-like glycoprotein n=1 Tax=Trypanosoma rangeli TaxID=5698 RepID=R9TNL8_TRYRA|nr:mucin-like glycoprotein [Trypanosoma rangeli]
MAMAMAMVRRRAVCALAVVAVLCGCFSSVCGATNTGVYAVPGMFKEVPVEISCAGSDEKLSWRVLGGSEWAQCAAKLGVHDYAVEGGGVATEVLGFASIGGAQSDNDDAGASESVCLSAESLYVAAGCEAKCAAATTKVSAEKQTAFTMEFPMHVGSGVHKKWEEARSSSSRAPLLLDGAETGLFGTSGVCLLTDPAEKPAAKAESAPQRTASPPAPADEPAASPVDAAASSEATTGSEESAAHGHGATQTPSASAAPPNTPPPAPPAGGAEGSATTTTATTSSSSPVAWKHTKSKADGSDTALLMARTTLSLLLLLMAAVACAAGR